MMKDKENIDETGLYVYAMPFKQEEDLYRWKILILVPLEYLDSSVLNKYI